MGKKDKKPAAAAADTAADIDDIFAAPAKKAPKGDKQPAAKDKKDKGDKSDKSGKSEKKDKKDKSEKKRKPADADEPPPKKKRSKDAAAPQPQPQPQRVVEEVVDPSLAVKAAVEKAKVAKQAPAKRAGKGKEVEEDMAFRDSRGDTGRALSDYQRADRAEADPTRETHRGGLPRVQGGRAQHRPRGGRHPAVPVRLRVL